MTETDLTLLLSALSVTVAPWVLVRLLPAGPVVGTALVFSPVQMTTCIRAHATPPRSTK